MANEILYPIGTQVFFREDGKTFEGEVSEYSPLFPNYREVKTATGEEHLVEFINMQAKPVETCEECGEETKGESCQNCYPTSTCCDAPFYEESDICTDCKEHGGRD